MTLTDLKPQPRPPMWIPEPGEADHTELARYARWVAHRYGLGITTYRQLWEWSARDVSSFWTSIVDYFDLPMHGRSDVALADARMPGASWFPGSTLNIVDQLLRYADSDAAAVIECGERPDGSLSVRTVSWRRLTSDVGSVASTLRHQGVGSGDRVVGYVPNCYEAVVAFLATASLGAVWAACGLEYAPQAVLSRFDQLEPKVLIAATGYRFDGLHRERTSQVVEVASALPSLETTILIPRDTQPVRPQLGESIAWAEATAGKAEIQTEPVPFAHPLWVLFSSGTTGVPKGIVHGHGGILVEHVKNLALQVGLTRNDVFWWQSSPSWMMWNLQASGLLVGATIVCYDGSTSWPTGDAAWRIASRLGVTVMGTSPGYVTACMKDEQHPPADQDLASLRIVGVTGSPLSESTAEWLQAQLGSAVQVAVSSGGTDVATSFAGSSPITPVWPGEMSAPSLGVALAAYDSAGQPLTGEVGELVVTEPMPSMPIAFWNDPDGSKYRASYFETFPGVWRHGDWVTLTERGTVVIHGRSDSTLNRQGVRMGSSEIYNVVEEFPEVQEALVVGVERPDGGYWMPMFVTLSEDVELDQSLIDRLSWALKENASPRHVPDNIIAVPGIPHTRTGKKLELHVKHILQGAPRSPADQNNVDQPDLLAWYERFGAQQRDGRSAAAADRQAAGRRAVKPRTGPRNQ